MLKSVGLRTAPCGTPAEIVFFSLSVEPILTWKVRPVRNDCTVCLITLIHGLLRLIFDMSSVDPLECVSCSPGAGRYFLMGDKHNLEGGPLNEASPFKVFGSFTQFCDFFLGLETAAS